jgi:hypothetical protein
MEETCNKLIETFDTNILDNQNNIIQAAFYSQAKEYKDKSKDNTLFKLIRNHYDSEIQKQRPVIDYLGGPYVFRHMYSKEYDMTVYLFGELHSNITDCPTLVGKKFELVENYFKRLVENTDVFLDIYFEFPGYDKRYYSNVEYMAPQRMQELFKKFYRCVEELSRKSKECELSRMHYIDIRTIIDSFAGINETSWLIRNLLIKSNSEGLLRSFYKDNIIRIRNIFNNLNNDNFDKYLDYWLFEILSNKYVKKELERSFLEKEIYKYIKDMIKNLSTIYRKNIRNIIKGIEKNINFKKKFQSLLNYLIAINLPIVEAYTLSRIFKKFKIKNRLEQPVTPHNIIYYAGSAHSLNIENFLLKIGFEMREKVGSNIDAPEIGISDVYKNCINMSKIKQPLFDN